MCRLGIEYGVRVHEGMKSPEVTVVWLGVENEVNDRYDGCKSAMMSRANIKVKGGKSSKESI
jgi:hypothetical protein